MGHFNTAKTRTKGGLLLAVAADATVTARSISERSRSFGFDSGPKKGGGSANHCAMAPRSRACSPCATPDVAAGDPQNLPAL